MIQVFASGNHRRTPRRAAALLLAVLLNLALVPCTMALEVVEQGHDCCPPELTVEAADCCEIDDANVGARGGLTNADGDAEYALVSISVALAGDATPHFRKVIDPPDPPAPHRAVHKLNCVYLK